ncbi:unnamed protein product [Trichogramma brassicae]|uniref:Receptor ligand binding region domain-containing protein n=1 Tax=Trichogramma brassicae TaxID=86971 RepID=A0A6H5I455_9HYME|nr:unnamed protein product [Trichogramma brassicae]
MSRKAAAPSCDDTNTQVRDATASSSSSSSNAHGSTARSSCWDIALAASTSASAAIKHFDWSYVYLVYTDTEYGKRGKEALEALAHNYNVCFGFLHCIDKDISDEPIYDAIIHNITQKSDIRGELSLDSYFFFSNQLPLSFFLIHIVVVMFAEKVATLRVIRAARRLNASEQLVWIGSDIWSSGKRERELSPDEEHILEGALAVQPLYTHMAGFDDYFTNLTLEHVEVNPWFDEFWTEYHRCRGANGSVSNDEESLHPRVTSFTISNSTIDCFAYAAKCKANTTTQKTSGNFRLRDASRPAEAIKCVSVWTLAARVAAIAARTSAKRTKISANCAAWVLYRRIIKQFARGSMKNLSIIRILGLLVPWQWLHSHKLIIK